MIEPISKSRRELLVQLESIVGNECYNGNIQNYGPGGVRKSDGRSFRYPITFREENGAKVKISARAVPQAISSDMLHSGYYAFGANQLDVMTVLERILQYLERHHGLVIET